MPIIPTNTGPIHIQDKEPEPILNAKHLQVNATLGTVGNEPLAFVDWDSISTMDELIAVLKSAQINISIPERNVPPDLKHCYRLSIKDKDPTDIVKKRADGWKFQNETEMG